MNRAAFSLLEIIIATAVLAASAMVLSSLIGLGSKYGNRAEERTIATSQAESLMDECLAQLANANDPMAERTGELPGPPRRGFRISTTPFAQGTFAQGTFAQGTGASASDSPGEGKNRSSSLLRITVEVFETGGANLNGDTRPLVRLSRLTRTAHSTQGAIP